MSEPDSTLKERLAAATVREKAALAAALTIAADGAGDGLDEAISRAYVRFAKRDSYRETLAAVAQELTRNARWDDVHVESHARIEWVEEYCSRAAAFAARPDRKHLPPDETKRLREEAVTALAGTGLSAEKQAEVSWGAILGVTAGVTVAALLGWWLAPFLAGKALIVTVAGTLRALATASSSPDLSRVVPATLILIHVRKRMEFEGLVQKLCEAA
jgi:hypothetical protein